MFCEKGVLNTLQNSSGNAFVEVFSFGEVTGYRIIPLEVFLGTCVPKICRKFTGEHPWQSAELIMLQSNFIEIALRHGCSPVNLVHIFRTPFPRNTFGWLLSYVTLSVCA